MKRNSVAISIIMGIYNPSPKEFRLAVESILGQTDPDWELILYDDGSDAAHQDTIQAIASLDPRIHLLRGEENRGLAYGLNQCIRHSGGKYIARMDADDLALPNRLERQSRFLETHPEYDWVGSTAELLNEDGVWGYFSVPERPLEKDYLPYSPFIHPSVMFRKSVFHRFGGYCVSETTRRCEDYELFFRLFYRGCRGYNLQEPLLQYREDQKSYRKRGFRSGVREMQVRYRGFRSIGMLKPSTVPYVLKPLAVGATPAKLQGYLRKQRKRRSVH